MEEYDPQASLVSVDQDQIEKTFNEKWLKKLQEYRLGAQDDTELTVTLDNITQRCQVNLNLLQENADSARLTVFNSYYYMYLDAIDPLSFIFFGLFQINQAEFSTQRRAQTAKRLNFYINGDEKRLPFIEGVKEHIRSLRDRYLNEGKTPSYPSRSYVEAIINNSWRIFAGISYFVFEGMGRNLSNYWHKISDPYANYKSAGVSDLLKLRRQVADYNQFLRKELLPYAQDVPGMPFSLYQSYLQLHGVFADPNDLIEKGKADFAQTKEQFNNLSLSIAHQRGWESDDPMEILDKLEKESSINIEREYLEVVDKTMKEIEGIIQEHHLVPLAKAPIRTRFGSWVENVVQPYPHVTLPRFIQNENNFSTFVFGNWKAYGNTHVEIASLVAHEIFPGHMNQLNTLIELNLDLCRSILSFNSANLEGWGLYGEEIMYPYFDKPQQLGVLKFRLLRQARMFLDPMLNLKMISKDEAKQFLMEHVGANEIEADVEVKRYTILMPGQATSYYWGYLKIHEAKEKIREELQNNYSEYKFHEVYLSYGFLPIEKTIDFVKNAMITKS